MALVIPANEDAIPEVLSIVTLNPTTLSLELEVVAMKLTPSISVLQGSSATQTLAHIPLNHQASGAKWGFDRSIDQICISKHCG